MKTKAILTSLAVITIISLLTTCKKYPENTLWFKSPNSTLGRSYLNAFTVDGVDSMPMWNRIYNTPPYNGYTPPPPNEPYDIKGTVVDFHYRGTDEFLTDFGLGSFHFFDHKKQIYIYSRMDVTSYLPPPTYNLFYTSESNWKILKLTKNGDFKIQRTYNNKIYEMEFIKY